MKKITKIISIVLFFLISVFYTNKSIDILKNNDPIMKQIKNTKEKYTISPINAIINGNEIQSGTYGKEIDYESSYTKMKRYGKYNEALTVLKDTKPTISIEDTYDKYLTKGNSNKRNVSLVFKITDDKNIMELLSLLEKKDVQVTFFIDGTLLENNAKVIKSLSNHEVEILSYNNKQEETFMTASISYLESLTNREAKFCYTENDNEDLLKMCSKNKLHTIKPTLVLKNDIYNNIKKSVEKDIVITIDNYQGNNLSSSIDYLKSKGYNLVTIQDMFDEST